MVKNNDYNSYAVSIRKQVFKLLDSNPLLTAKMLCNLLKLPYPKYKQTITNYRYFWKYNHKNERGSKCSSHCWRGFCFVVGALRTKAVDVGWVVSRSRNRFLLWRDGVGRMCWFETGRVNLFVRKPANLGRAYQLVCNGFFNTGLITDLKVLEAVLATVRFKSAHFVFETSQRLPKLSIELFKGTNGIQVKVGDRTHPHAVEVIAEFMDQLEAIDHLLRSLQNTNHDFEKKDIGVV